MVNSKELLNKIASIYEADPDKGIELLDLLHKAAGDKGGKKKRSYGRDWSPRGDLSPEEQAEIQKHMDDGYSEREAHRLAGTHREHGDINKAMKSGVNPSIMSEKMMGQLKELAREWIDNYDNLRQRDADPEKNPVLHAMGKLKEAHAQHSKNEDLQSALDEFKQSEEYQNAHRFKKPGLLHEFEQNWHNENPEHMENYISGMSEAKEEGQSGMETYKQGLQEKMDHIMRGSAMQSDTSAAEAAQHAGIDLGGEGEQATGAIQKDPFAAFAARNPKFVAENQQKFQDMQDRHSRVISAKAAQTQAQGAPAEEAPAAPKTVIRRRKKDG